jgi:23S rRNA pseudouridine2605 synthase
MLERLQKIIARAGVASRRRAEDLIVAGEVQVNGKVVTELGTKADPEKDSIRVAGRMLRMPERRILLALNKPDGYVSTLSDPSGRPTLRDCLSGVSGRVFPVGRLEFHSTGLILLTNDGDVAARLFAALGRGLPQTYHVKVKNPFTAAEVETISRRVGPIRPSRPGPNPWYEVRLSGARHDRLRKIIGDMGHLVEKLKRVAIGPIELEDLPTGRWRAVSEKETRLLEEAMKRLPSGARPSSERKAAPERRGKRKFGQEKKA